MMEEVGRVVALEPGAAWVETERQDACGSCAARSGCGHGLLGGMGSRRGVVRATLAESAPLELCLHDRVRISLPERGFLRGVGLLYVFPLLSAVGAAVLASLVWDNASVATTDLRNALAAAVGLGGGLLLVRRISNHDADAAALNPVVTGRISTCPDIER